MTITVDKSQPTIEVLHGSNFKRWNEDVRFAFVMIKIDIALRVPKLAAITAKSAPNLMCLYAIKRIVFDHILSGLTKIEDAKALYDVMGERYHKSKARNLMSKLMSMTYDSYEGVRDFIMKMVDI